MKKLEIEEALELITRLLAVCVLSSNKIVFQKAKKMHKRLKELTFK